MNTRLCAALAVLLLAACRPKPSPGPAYAPPPGKRAFSLSIDSSQTRFLKAGDAVQVVLLASVSRPDGTDDARSDVLAPSAEVLRVDRDWADSSGLVQLALTPEEAQYAALAADRQDRLLLDALPAPPRPLPRRAPPAPRLTAGRVGVAVLVYADQQEFLSPGDRVDVVATRESPRAEDKTELKALTLFQDVTVLGAAPPKGDEQWATVQLMLTPEQARAVGRSVSAQDDLSLPVRAAGDDATRPVEPATLRGRFGSSAERRAQKS
jgi:Flp pilus assembly protein CpaB